MIVGKGLKYYVTKNNVFLGKNKDNGNSETDPNAKPSEKENDGATLQEFIYEQIDKFFVDHIPIETIKDLQGVYLYFFGIVAHILAFLLFIYFVYDNYTQATNQAYISLTTSGADCNTVPISITGTYLADFHGNWAGTPEYQESKALYQLSLSNFEINTNEQFVAMMNSFYDNLESVGEKAQTYNLAENLIIWMTYIQYYSVQDPGVTNFTSIGYGQLQTLQLTADPAIVFNLIHTIQRFSSVEGVCALESYTSYDMANHRFNSYYSNASMFSDPIYNCTAAVNPLTFGYYPLTDGLLYNVPLYVQALSVALGVNFGIIPFQSLRIISRRVSNFTYGKVEYSFGEYFDIRYPTMQPLFCMKNMTDISGSALHYQQLCFMALGTTFAVPIFNQYGAGGEAKAVYCDCSDPYLRSDDSCSQFNFLSGLLFYRSESTGAGDITGSDIVKELRTNITGILQQFGLFNILSMLQQYPDYRTFNKMAYNASFLTINEKVPCDATCRKDAFAFCRIPGKSTTCSLDIVGSETSLLDTVSEYKYQLRNASCTNSMVITPENWQKLINNPPVQFTQIYYECYQAERPAFIAAVGVASGNTQIFIPFFVFGLLPFLYFLLVAIQQVPPKEEYHKSERSEATEILALLLLRIRDGKTRGIKKNGTLQSLAKELIAAAKEEGGYPDSDDEDDETETDGGNNSHSLKKNKRSSAKRNDSLISVDEEYDDRDSSMIDANSNQHRHQKSSKTVRSIPKHNTRLRMGVFTKQLKGKYVEEGDDRYSVDARRSSGGSLAYPRRTTTAPEGKETELTSRPSEMSRRTTATNDLERVTTSNGAGESINMGPRQVSRRKSSLLGYLFGGMMTTETTNPSDDSTVLRVKGRRILDAELDVLPQDLQVLNHFEEEIYDRSKALTEQEFAILLDDLLQYLNEALSQIKDSRESESQGDYHSSQNPMFSGGFSRDRMASGIATRSNRDIPAFLQAKELTKRLIRVNFMEMYRKEEVETYIKLSNILCMHASIELDCEMMFIASNYSKRIAYDIGGKILTIEDLNHMV